MDALFLSRLQFAWVIALHILLPAFTVGLAAYIAVLEGIYFFTRRAVFLRLSRFWLRLFAVSFGMGVASGIVMPFQFGTNWSRFADVTADVIGPLMAYEVLMAFFLEAGFLGVMLFGWNRVGPGLHFLATCLVALGTLVSATWILGANSWMQTPQGYEIVNGKAVPADWIAIIFNPSFPFRLMHMAVAAFLATALFVGATGAWHLLKGNDKPAVRTMLSMAMWMMTIVAPIQALLGDAHGLNTARYQPVKVAALEGHWENGPPEQGMPLILFGIPDMQAERTRYAVEVPHLGSVILTHSWDGQLKGMKEFAPELRPNSLIIFWSFRLMVGLGLLMIALGFWSLWLRRGDRMYRARRFLQAATVMGPAGLLAVLAGWITTEVGRQPWVVYGVMRTADGASAHGFAPVAVTLGLFVVIYFFVFGVGFAYILRLARKGPQAFDMRATPEGGPGLERTPSRPMSAAPQADDEGWGGPEIRS